MTQLQLSENWANTWARQMTRTVFGQAPKKKMGDSEFQKHLEACCQYGFIQALEHLILAFEINPAETGELVIGDAQVMLMREYNLFKKKHLGKVPDCSIEGIMERAKAFKQKVEDKTKQSWPTFPIMEEQGPKGQEHGCHT